MNKNQTIALLITIIFLLIIFLGFGWETIKFQMYHSIIPRIPAFRGSLMFMRNTLLMVAAIIGLLFVYLLRTKPPKP